MKKVKVVVIGNSVGIRVRPPLESPHNLNYSQLLEQLISDLSPDSVGHVENISLHRLMAGDVLESIENYITKLPHFFIINLGVVDASSREIPLWYANIQKKNKSFFGKAFSWFHMRIIVPNRRLFVKLRGGKSWVKLQSFTESYEKIVQTLLKETNARVIAIGINQGDKRIEESLPGSMKKYGLYNEQIASVTRSFGQLYIEVNDFLTQEDFPDGIHYNAEGHKKVASRLFEEITIQLHECFGTHIDT